MFVVHSILCDLEFNADSGIDMTDLANSGGEHGILSKDVVGWDPASLLGSVALPVDEVL